MLNSVMPKGVEWTRPDFEEISLGMEVTAYVNTDAAVGGLRQEERNAVEQAQPTTSQ